MNARELMIRCEERIEYGYFRLMFYSFTGNFESVSKYVPFDKLDENETDKFIAACENRRVRAKTLMNEIAPVIGFVVIAVTVLATIISKQCDLNGGWYDLLKEIVYALFYGTTMIFLLIVFTFLFAMLAQYRVHVHAWTVFGEAAILRKSPAGGGAS